jgi:hypothetical protein
VASGSLGLLLAHLTGHLTATLARIRLTELLDRVSPGDRGCRLNDGDVRTRGWCVRRAAAAQLGRWARRLKSENETDTSRDNRVFNKTDWAAAGLVVLVALTIYFVTLAPSVTLEQSGAFVVAGQYLGIGRVPGYPLWHLLAKGFITVFGFVRYRGHPNPACPRVPLPRAIAQMVVHLPCDVLHVQCRSCDWGQSQVRRSGRLHPESEVHPQLCHVGDLHRPWFLDDSGLDQ